MIMKPHARLLEPWYLLYSDYGKLLLTVPMNPEPGSNCKPNNNRNSLGKYGLTNDWYNNESNIELQNALPEANGPRNR